MTLIEMMIAMALSSVILVAIAGVLANNQRGWNMMYRRVNSDVVVESEIARRVFDRIVRQATIQKCVVGTSGELIEVYYASSAALSSPDRYANFFWDVTNQELKVQYGQLESGTYNHASADSPTVVLLAHHVMDCKFSMSNICIRMSFRLNDGNQSPLDVNCTATRHNE